MTTEQTHPTASTMTPIEILNRLQSDGAAAFDGLAEEIARCPCAGELTKLLLPWHTFAGRVAAILALVGKSIDDLQAAVLEAQERA